MMGQHNRDKAIRAAGRGLAAVIIAVVVLGQLAGAPGWAIWGFGLTWYYLFAAAPR